MRLHTGKTRVWNRASVCPEGTAEFGPDVWNPEGVKVGTIVGSRAFVEEINKRLRGEQKLGDAIAWVPDLQPAWQIFIQCAGPTSSGRCPLHNLQKTPKGMTKGS